MTPSAHAKQIVEQLPHIVAPGHHGRYVSVQAVEEAIASALAHASTAHDDCTCACHDVFIREGTDEAVPLGAATAPADTKGSEQ